MKYLIKFSKDGMMKYISHLDIIRLFNRAFKRAGIELEHSQGFNPHPKLVFAQPLSLGYTSDCELAQIDTVEAFKEDMLAHMINDQMPNGISILSCKKQEKETKSIAAGITEAAYTIKLPEKSKANALICIKQSTQNSDCPKCFCPSWTTDKIIENYILGISIGSQNSCKFQPNKHVIHICHWPIFWQERYQFGNGIFTVVHSVPTTYRD